MAKTAEERFLEFIKIADSEATTEVYEDENKVPHQNTDAVTFSDTAQEVSKDVREGVMGRLLAHKSKSDAAERALVGNVLPRGETSSIQLKPVEKVSFPRTQTLMEKALERFGRV